MDMTDLKTFLSRSRQPSPVGIRVAVARAEPLHAGPEGIVFDTAASAP